MINPLSLILVLIATILGAIGIILMKQGINKKKIINLTLIGGIALFGISTLFFITALQFGELHLLYTLTGLTYIWLLILSHKYLEEPITKHKLIGTIAIIIGVILISV